MARSSIGVASSGRDSSGLASREARPSGMARLLAYRLARGMQREKGVDCRAFGRFGSPAFRQASCGPSMERGGTVVLGRRSLRRLADVKQPDFAGVAVVRSIRRHGETFPIGRPGLRLKNDLTHSSDVLLDHSI